MCSLWPGIHILEPPKETHEESGWGETTPLLCGLCGKALKQTHLESCWRESKPGTECEKVNNQEPNLGTTKNTMYKFLKHQE